MTQAQTIQDIIQNKQYLAWYIKEKHSLSQKSSLEHILNYGDWQDYKQAEAILGLPTIKTLYKKISNAKRVNLRPKTIHFFNLYFKKHA